MNELVNEGMNVCMNECEIVVANKWKIGKKAKNKRSGKIVN